MTILFSRHIDILGFKKTDLVLGVLEVGVARVVLELLG
jgi:hypothetical protein